MKKWKKLAALTMTATMFLAACGDTPDTDVEDPATDTEMDTDVDTGTDLEEDIGDDAGED